MYTAPGAWRRNFDVHLRHKDGLSWQHWRWEAILLDSAINVVPNRKQLAHERLSPFHKSASNITHSAIASKKRSACVLYTVQYALTAYSVVLRSRLYEYSVQAVVRRRIIQMPTVHYNVVVRSRSTRSTDNYVCSLFFLVPVLRKPCQNSCSAQCDTCILHFACVRMRCVDFHDQPFRSQYWARFH